MKSIFSSFNKNYMFAMLFLFTSLPARANYDTDCIKRLLVKQTSTGMIEYKKTWIRNLRQNLHSGRDLSDMEFEAVMDWSRGLSLIAIFDDGKKTSLTTRDTRSFKKLSNALRKRKIVAVKLMPDSLEKLGAILKKACEVLERPGCMSYLDYSGLGSTTSRPLSAAEEQAVKWATLYMVSPESMVSSLRVVSRNSDDFISDQLAAEELRKAHARQIIRDRFSEADAHILLSNYVEPAISANFARILAIYKGSQEY
jgi:hypothetical protein